MWALLICIGIKVLAEVSEQEVGAFARHFNLVGVLRFRVWLFHRGDMQHGKLHAISNAWKATCGRHARCICYVTNPAGADRSVQVFADLVEWLASSSDLVGHVQESRALRRDKYHMRIRS